jgi:hypothetical protein
MPLVLMIDIIVDSHRRAKGKPAVGAANKHHFGESIVTRLHDCQHVHVVVRSHARMIDRQKQLSIKTARIYPTAR